MIDFDITPEVIELILRTSRVNGLEDVYSLAPRGHRVGVYFQQRRAILLAAAIATRIGSDALRDYPIAIVGGGVSGLTFLLALGNAGAEQVFLFEAADELIKKGMDSNHRLIHPNYNRWPLLGSMDIFTRLPLLNWYAASADCVIRQLKEEVAERHKDAVHNSVNLNHKVDKIVRLEDDKRDPLQLIFENSASQQSRNFRLVVVAAGFDKERRTDDINFKDYWTRDTSDFDFNEHIRKTEVYGVGDGALIDIVRCCAKDPEKAWHIPLGTIARLRPKTAVTLRRAGTQDNSDTLKFSRYEKRIQHHEESIRSVAWAMTRSDENVSSSYAKIEEDFYRQLIIELKRDRKDLIRFLDESFKPLPDEKSLRPVLIGVLDSGFEPTSAPINKLLLAYLIESERVVYSKRDRPTQSIELDEWLAHAKVPPSGDIKICRFGAPKNFPLSGSTADPKNGVNLYDYRHRIIYCESEMEAKLIDALSGMTGGEYIYFDEMPSLLTRARFGKEPKAITADTRSKNINILRNFAKDVLSAKDASYDEGKDTEFVILTPLNHEEITKRLMEIGGLDGYFLGLPILVANPILVAKEEKPQTGGF